MESAFASKHPRTKDSMTIIRFNSLAVILLCVLSAGACDSPSDLDTPQRKIYDEPDEGVVKYQLLDVTFHAFDQLNSSLIEFDCNWPDEGIELYSDDGDFFLTIPQGSTCIVKRSFQTNSILQSLELNVQDKSIEQRATSLTGNPDLGEGARAKLDFGGSVDTYIPDNAKHFLSMEFTHERDQKQLEVEFAISVTLRTVLQQPVNARLTIIYQ